MKRRSFLSTMATTPIALQGLACDATRNPPFKILYSNDTTHITSCASPYHRKGEPFRADMLRASVDEVAGLVDAHLLQPGLGMVPMWPSRVLPLEEHYAWIRERYGQAPDSYGKFVLAGGDVVQVFVDRCRLRQQAAFVSVRLNDSHHKEYVDPKPGDKPGTSIGMSVTRFYAEHPDLRIRPGSIRGSDLVFNWAEPIVRELKLQLIDELCERYDLDGLELDFLRTYSFFRLDETTPRQRTEVMTQFVRDVRAILDRYHRRDQRKWLSVRIPCYLAAFDPLGIDLSALVASGVDIVNASSHYFTTQQHDLDAIRRLAPDAWLYFELCHTLWKGDKVVPGYDVFPYRRATREHLQTTAHQAYSQGVDGISLFNFPYYREHGKGEGRGTFGEPPFDVLRHLRDPRMLAEKPQHWFLASGWRARG